MLLTDVNVLIYAFRKDMPEHAEYRAWLENLINAPSPYAVSDLVLSGVLRVVTNPKVFRQPSTLEEALSFVEIVRNHPRCRPIMCGQRQWEIFVELCRSSDARGNLVADAFLAAIAIDAGCEWITTDHDYARFARLRWRHPLHRK